MPMSQPRPEPTLGELAAQVADLKLGFKCLLGIFLVVISLPNILASLAIHRFEEIYQDTLAGQVLPAVTSALVGHPQFAQFLTFAWPVCGLLLIAVTRRTRYWALGGAFLIFAIGLQFALTEYALITPLFGIPRN
jgi:hypothetical protein